MTDRPHILALDHIASIQDPIRVTDNSGNPHLHYSAQHVKAAFLAGAASLPPATDPAISGLSSFPPNWKLRQMHFSAPCADDRKWHVNVYGGREGGDTFVGRGASADQALRDAARNARAALAAAPTIPATGEAVPSSLIEECIKIASIEVADAEESIEIGYRPAHNEGAREAAKRIERRIRDLAATIPATGHAATEGEGA